MFATDLTDKDDVPPVCNCCMIPLFRVRIMSKLVVTQNVNFLLCKYFRFVRNSQLGFKRCRECKTFQGSKNFKFHPRCCFQHWTKLDGSLVLSITQTGLVLNICITDPVTRKCPKGLLDKLLQYPVPAAIVEQCCNFY